MSYLALLSAKLPFEQLESYRPKPQGTDEGCLARYLWNIQLCTALQPSLHFLEVVYRNAVHTAFSNVFHLPVVGHTRWLLDNTTVLLPPERERVIAAKAKLARQPHPTTEDLLVAELSLGFWTSLLNTEYRLKWHQTVKRVFPFASKAERDLNNLRPMLNRVRELRNASAHRRTIWHWSDLAQIHANTHLLLGWMLPDALSPLRAIDDFPRVHQLGLAPLLPEVSALCAPILTSPTQSV